MAERKVYHSSNTKDGWKVTHGGAPVSSHASQEDAEAEAIRLGRKAQEDGGLARLSCTKPMEKSAKNAPMARILRRPPADDLSHHGRAES